MEKENKSSGSSSSTDAINIILNKVSDIEQFNEGIYKNKRQYGAQIGSI